MEKLEISRMNDGRKRESYFLPEHHLRKLRATALDAQRSGQREVCGVLSSNGRGYLELRFMDNQSSRPGHFNIEAAEYSTIRRGLRKQGKRVLGTFHSHPISEAIPSRGDMAGAALNTLCLIYDVCGREARLWRIIKRGKRRIAREIRLELRRIRRRPAPIR